MRRRRHNIAAFTLMELVIVLLVLAIMVAIVAPSLRGFGVGRKSDAVANQLVSMANWARSQAVNEGTIYRLNLDLASRSFDVQVQLDGGFGPAAGEYGDSIYLADGMTMETSVVARQEGTYIEFRPDGRCEAGRIFLTDAFGKRTEIASASPTELYHIIKPGEVDQ